MPPAPAPLPVAFGLGLAAVGLAALKWRASQRDRAEARDARGELEDWERNFHRARHRRRGKVAGILLFLAAAIPAGDALAVAAGPRGAAWFTAYLAVILAGVGSLVLLGVADWLASASHLRDRVADVTARRVALEHALRDYKAELARERDAAGPAAEGEKPRRPVRNRLREYHFGD